MCSLSLAVKLNFDMLKEALILGLDKFCSQNGLFCLPAMLAKIAYSARNSARGAENFQPLGPYLFLKMEAGSLSLTPNSLCKAKSLYHFIISVEMVNFLLGSYKQFYISIFLTNVTHIIRDTDFP